MLRVPTCRVALESIEGHEELVPFSDDVERVIHVGVAAVEAALTHRDGIAESRQVGQCGIVAGFFA